MRWLLDWPSNGVDALDQLARTEGLGDVVVRAHSKPIF